MSFVRPEARAALFRIRELIVAGLLGLVGLYWGLTAFGVLFWLGWVVLAVAVLLFFTFLQRVWFAGREDGPGYVEVIEGQITYYSTETGGAVAVRELTQLLYDTRASEPKWVLRQPQLPDLSIPASAKGAPELFDAFAALPGLTAERLLQAQRRSKSNALVIWQRENNLAIDSARAKDHSYTPT